MSEAPNREPLRDGPSGLGALIQTEYDRFDLGTHHGQALRARVRRRSLRLVLGRSRHLSLALGSTRPVAIEVTTAQRRYDVPVPPPSDPWRRFAGRVVLFWLASLILVRIARRLRRSPGRAASIDPLSEGRPRT